MIVAAPSLARVSQDEKNQPVTANGLPQPSAPLPITQLTA